VLLHLHNDVDRFGHIEPFAGDAHGVVNFGQVMFLKLDVEHRTDHLHHAADVMVFALLLVLILPSHIHSLRKFSPMLDAR